MPVNKKITIVGAGSASFGLSVIKGLIEYKDLEGIHLVLHDVNENNLERMGRIAEYLNKHSGSEKTLSWTTDRIKALEGADCVILSVASDRERTWKKDRDIGLKFGINHYAENGGPAAIFHTARNLKIIMPIVRDMEKYCGSACLLNYTNPVTRICTAVKNYSSIRCLGICHQLGFGYYMAGVLLSDVLGIELPEKYHFRWTDESLESAGKIGEQAVQKIHIHAAGLNHFTWALSIRKRDNGEDLYPLLRERNKTFDPSFEPLTRRIFELFGCFPTPGDNHLAEYLPFTHNVNRRTWEKYDIQMYDFSWSNKRREQRLNLAEKVAETKDYSLVSGIESERAEKIVSALLNRITYFDENMNMINNGGISNLPDHAVVEFPCVFTPSGIHPVLCGNLPEPAAELCKRQVLINEMSVKGILEKNRDLLIQALAMDPMIDDPDLPEKILEESPDIF